MANKTIKAIVSFDAETDSALLTKTDLIITAMTGNTNFTGVIPTVADLQEIRDAYNASLISAGSGNHTAIAVKNANRLALETNLGTMGNFINTVARGNQVALTSSAFPLTKEPEPGYLGPVEFMKLSPGVNSGTLLCRLKKVKNAKCYTFMITEDPVTDESVWKSYVSTSSRYLFQDLVPGKMYSVKVIVAGTRGQTVQSGPISQYALQ